MVLNTLKNKEKLIEELKMEKIYLSWVQEVLKTFVVNQNDDGKTLYIAPTGMAALNMESEKAMTTIHSTLKCGEKVPQCLELGKVKKFILRKKAIKIFLIFMMNCN